MVPGCRRDARLVTLPLTQRRVWVCQFHRPGMTIGAMRELIAHG
jgi:hypothetical protein